MKPTVLVYKTDLLPYSETFIKEQLLAYENWRAVLVGHQRRQNGLSLDGLEVRLLLTSPPTTAQNYLWRLRRLLGLHSRNESRRLNAENAHVFHAHFGTVAVDIWPLVRKLKLPLVVTLHGFDVNVHREWWESGHGGWRRRTYPRKLLALANQPDVHFVAVSKSIRQRAIDYGIPAKRVTVCHIGVDTKRFKPSDHPIVHRARRVLFVGRLVEKKRCSDLLSAFAIVSRNIPEAELFIIGDGPLRSDLEKQARTIKGSISFLGTLPSDETKRQMDHARVFCLPSTTTANGDAEGLPISILEAQACGIPVVTTAEAGMTEVIANSQNGFLCKAGDIRCFATSICNILTSDILASTMAISARKIATEHFSIGPNTKKLEYLYTQMTTKHHEQP